MKYTYELYEHTVDKGILFKGYRVIIADSSESARLSAEQTLADNVKLYEVYTAQ